MIDIRGICRPASEVHLSKDIFSFCFARQLTVCLHVLCAFLYDNDYRGRQIHDWKKWPGEKLLTGKTTEGLFKVTCVYLCEVLVAFTRSWHFTDSYKIASHSRQRHHRPALMELRKLELFERDIMNSPSMRVTRRPCISLWFPLRISWK